MGSLECRTVIVHKPRHMMQKTSFQRDKAGEKDPDLKRLPFSCCFVNSLGRLLFSFPFEAVKLHREWQELVCRCHVTKTQQCAKQDPSRDCQCGI